VHDETNACGVLNVGGLRANMIYVIREQDPCGVRPAALGREELVVAELTRAMFLLKALTW
jgi:hypothetical protein